MSQHGTYGSYAGGCRCRLCRAAKAAYMRAKRAMEPQPYIWGIRHGYAGYQDHKCRCDVCRKAAGRHWKRQALARIERSREATRG